MVMNTCIYFSVSPTTFIELVMYHPVTAAKPKCTSVMLKTGNNANTKSLPSKLVPA